jgi:hypothetical protein
LSRHKVVAISAMLASFLFLGSFLVLGKVFGTGLTEYQSRIVQRFADSPNMPSEEQSESGIGEVNNIASIESEVISIFSPLGMIVLTTIGLSFLLLGVIFIRFRRDIFEDLSTW